VAQNKHVLFCIFCVCRIAIRKFPERAPKQFLSSLPDSLPPIMPATVLDESMLRKYIVDIPKWSKSAKFMNFCSLGVVVMLGLT
jgi:hypothetical protein